MNIIIFSRGLRLLDPSAYQSICITFVPNLKLPSFYHPSLILSFYFYLCLSFYSSVLLVCSGIAVDINHEYMKAENMQKYNMKQQCFLEDVQKLPVSLCVCMLLAEYKHYVQRLDLKIKNRVVLHYRFELRACVCVWSVSKFCVFLLFLKVEVWDWWKTLQKKFRSLKTEWSSSSRSHTHTHTHTHTHPRDTSHFKRQETVVRLPKQLGFKASLIVELKAVVKLNTSQILTQLNTDRLQVTGNCLYWSETSVLGRYASK